MLRFLGIEKKINILTPFKIFYSVLTISSILFCESSLADFNVRGGEGYQSKRPYGNTENIRFHRAINGQALNAQEEAELAAKIPEKESGRYYGRGRFNFSSITLDQIKNQTVGGPSPAPGSDARGLVTRNKVTKGQMGLELAVGYIWSSTVRGDLEYLVNRNVIYTANPVLSGVTTPRSMRSEIKNNTILANAYYDFSGFDRFRPYLTLGLGLSGNTAISTLTPRPGDSGSGRKRTCGIAYAAGAGFRVSIFTRWYIDVAYRYINLGPVRMMPNSTFRLKGTLSMSAPSIGVIYLF